MLAMSSRSRPPRALMSRFHGIINLNRLLRSLNNDLIIMANTLPDLPYPYDALEPYISRQIMELHHKKHHQTYVNALNAAEAAYARASTPKERIALQAALKFNGGGKCMGQGLISH
jgi:hypothetical protein